MICPLGRALGCEGIDAEGNCEKYYDEGVKLRVLEGICGFKNIRAPRKGIYALKDGKKRNPLKQAKMEARANAVAKAPVKKAAPKLVKKKVVKT